MKDAAKRIADELCFEPCDRAILDEILAENEFKEMCDRIPEEKPAPWDGIFEYCSAKCVVDWELHERKADKAEKFLKNYDGSKLLIPLWEHDTWRGTSQFAKAHPELAIFYELSDDASSCKFYEIDGEGKIAEMKTEEKR